jgi:hypothetical protein
VDVPNRNFRNDYDFKLRRSRLTVHTELSSEDSPDFIHSRRDLDEFDLLSLPDLGKTDSGIQSFHETHLD